MTHSEKQRSVIATPFVHPDFHCLPYYYQETPTIINQAYQPSSAASGAGADRHARAAYTKRTADNRQRGTLQNS